MKSGSWKNKIKIKTKLGQRKVAFNEAELRARPGPSFQGWSGQVWRPWCPPEWSAWGPSRRDLRAGRSSGCIPLTHRPRQDQGLGQRSLAMRDIDSLPPTGMCSHHVAPDPRVCSHRAPPVQAQRQALQARLTVRQAAPPQLSEHSEGAAVTGLRTRVLKLCPKVPAPRLRPPPGDPVGWGREMGADAADRAAQAGAGQPHGRGQKLPGGREPQGAPWPARSCSPRAPCTASRRTWRSGRPPAPRRCPGTAAPSSSTGLWSRCCGR